MESRAGSRLNTVVFLFRATCNANFPFHVLSQGAFAASSNLATAPGGGLFPKPARASGCDPGRYM